MSSSSNAPRTRHGGPKSGSGSGKPGQLDPRKLGLVLAVVACPLGMLLAWPAATVLPRMLRKRRFSGLILLLGAPLVAVLLILAFRGLWHYLLPWREVVATVSGSSADVGLVDGMQGDAGTNVGDRLAALLRHRWGAWLLAMLPLSLCVALTRAGWVLWRQQVNSDKWHEEPEPELSELSEKRRAKIAAADANKMREVTKLSDAGTVPAFDQLEMPFAVTNRGTALRLLGVQFTAHLLLLGGSGFGKTETMMRIAYGWIHDWNKNRLPMVMLDFKGDPMVIAFARALAKLCGRRFVLVTADGAHATFTGMHQASPAQVADRLVEMLDSMPATKFESTYYRGAGTRWLLGVATALDNLVAKGKIHKDAPGGARPWRRDLGDLAYLAELPALKSVTKDLDGAARAYVQRRISRLDSEDTIGGMTTALALLVEMGAADALIFDPARDVDLEQCIRDGDMVLFSLDSAQNAAAARTIGNLVVADLLAVFSRLAHSKWSKSTDRRCAVWLDEYGGLSGNLLERFVERTRSQGGTLILSAQDDSTLSRVSENFRQTVMANSTVHVLHQQYGESADDYAKAIGTRAGMKETIQVMEDATLAGSEYAGSGVGSLRDVQQFIIDPNEMKQLSRGQVIVFSRLPWLVERCVVSRAPELPSAKAENGEDAGGKQLTVDLTKQSQERAADELAPVTPRRGGGITVTVHSEPAASPEPAVSRYADDDGWDVDFEDVPERTAPPEEIRA